MVGTFQNVKVLTCDERTNKKGEKYYLYNILSNGRVYNLYAKECFDFSADVDTDVQIELSLYNGNFNCKLVGVA